MAGLGMSVAQKTARVCFVALCNNRRTLQYLSHFVIKKLSHFVVNLKWIVGGQVNQIISIIIDNNKNNNTNIPLKCFQHQFFKWGRRKVFTSIATFRLQDLRRKVQLLLCGRPRDHEIVSITARVRSDGILNQNLAAIRIIAFSTKVRCP